MNQRAVTGLVIGGLVVVAVVIIVLVTLNSDPKTAILPSSLSEKSVPAPKPHRSRERNPHNGNNAQTRNPSPSNTPFRPRPGPQAPHSNTTNPPAAASPTPRTQNLDTPSGKKGIIWSGTSMQDASHVFRAAEQLHLAGFSNITHVIDTSVLEDSVDRPFKASAAGVGNMQIESLQNYTVEKNHFTFMSPLSDDALSSDTFTYPVGVHIKVVRAQKVHQVSGIAMSVHSRSVGGRETKQSLPYDALLTMVPLEHVTRATDMVSVKDPVETSVGAATSKRYHVLIGFRRDAEQPPVPFAANENLQLGNSLRARVPHFTIHGIRVSPRMHYQPLARVATRASSIVHRGHTKPSRGRHRSAKPGQYWSVLMDVEGPVMGNLVYEMMPVLIDAQVAKQGDAIIASAVVGGESRRRVVDVHTQATEKYQRHLADHMNVFALREDMRVEAWMEQCAQFLRAV